MFRRDWLRVGRHSDSPQPVRFLPLFHGHGVSRIEPSPFRFSNLLLCVLTQDSFCTLNEKSNLDDNHYTTMLSHKLNAL